MKRIRLLQKPGTGPGIIVPALLIAGSAAQAAKIGINFQDDWTDGGGAPVTEESFGVAAADWYNMPRVTNSIATSFSTSTTITVGGAPLRVEWSAVNTYSLTGDIPAAAGEAPGADQVVYGYLDDTGTGYRVKVSGLRNLAADYKVTLIASTDGGSGFTDATITHSSGAQTAIYGVPNPGDTVGALGGGIWAMSPETAVISATTENNSIAIQGAPRDNSMRSTLAGLIIDYTPATANVPVIEKQPTAPTGTIFQGGSFTLTAEASGSAALGYQWRRNTTPLPGRTEPTLALTGVTPADSGSYDVVVTNAAGTATSNAVSITVSAIAQPVITTPPLSQTFFLGYPATFTATATGGELTYVWKRGDSVLPAFTGPSMTLPAITAADAGTYSVTVTNAAGSATASAVLSVTAPGAGTYEELQAALKPLLWYRYSETEPLLTNTATVQNSGSAGAAGNGVVKRYMALQQPGALAGDTANKAVSMRTNSQFIDIPYNAALNPTVFTAELWVKPPPVNAGRIDPLINRGPNVGDGFLFFGWNGVTKWQFRCYDGLTRTQVNSTVDIVPGKWTHLVGVYDGTTARLYVDGVEQGSGTVGTYIPNSSMPMRLAGFPNDNGDVGGGNFTGGSIDEVAIYPTALTAAEVLAHYENGTNASRTTPYATLVQASAPSGYWRLDDPAGPVAPTPKNSGTAGSGWHGLYGGDLTPGAEGPRAPVHPAFGTANTAVGALAHGYNVVPPLGISSNTWTVTTWLKRAPIFTTGDLGWPAWLGVGGFHIDGTGGRPYGELRYHWDGSQWGWGSTLQVPEEIWTYCAMVLEPTKVTMYMGDTSNGLSLRKSSVNATHTVHTFDAVMSFGGNQAGRQDRNFIGQIDESAFYDRALSETEIAQLFLRSYGAIYGIDISPSGINPGMLSLTWPAGVLEMSTTMGEGEWIPIPEATSPWEVPVSDKMFYRARTN